MSKTQNKYEIYLPKLWIPRLIGKVVPICYANITLNKKRVSNLSQKFSCTSYLYEYVGNCYYNFLWVIQVFFSILIFENVKIINLILPINLKLWTVITNKTDHLPKPLYIFKYWIYLLHHVFYHLLYIYHLLFEIVLGCWSYTIEVWIPCSAHLSFVIILYWLFVRLSVVVVVDISHFNYLFWNY